MVIELSSYIHLHTAPKYKPDSFVEFHFSIVFSPYADRDTFLIIRLFGFNLLLAGIKQ